VRTQSHQAKSGYYKPFLVLMALVIVLLSIFGCTSSTQQIAVSAEKIREHSNATAGIAKGMQSLATLSEARFASIEAEAHSDSPNAQRIEEEAVLGRAEQAQIVANADLIIGSHHATLEAVGSVAKALTGVQDITPWWARTIGYILVSVSIIGICFILWYTGIGSFFRGIFGLITPKARKEAELAVATLDTEDPTTMREYVAAKRASDPEFDRAFIKAWRQHRDAAATRSPESQPAALNAKDTT